MAVESLLGNRFAPIQYSIGFLHSPFNDVVGVYRDWQADIRKQFGGEIEELPTSNGLESAFWLLEPLTTPQSRYLLMETNSDWTALFCNGLRLSDTHSPASVLCNLCKCRGVFISCNPDRFNLRHPDALRPLGGFTFTLFADHRVSEFSNTERSIGLINEGSKRPSWSFWQSGTVQPFEKPERYANWSKRQRFDAVMVEEYCAALGIRPFSHDFYGNDGIVFVIPGQTTQDSPSMSIAEANRKTLLS